MWSDSIEGYVVHCHEYLYFNMFNDIFHIILRITDIIRRIFNFSCWWIFCIRFSWFYIDKWSKIRLGTTSLLHFHYIYQWNGAHAHPLYFDLRSFPERSKTFTTFYFYSNICLLNSIKLSFYLLTINSTDTRNIIGHNSFYIMDIYGSSWIYISVNFEYDWCFAYIERFIHNVHCERTFWNLCSARNTGKIPWADNGTSTKTIMTNCVMISIIIWWYKIM